MLTVWKTLVLWYTYIMYCAANCNKTIKRQKLDANLVIPYFHKSVISSRNEVRLFSPVKIINAVNSLKSNECYNDYNCTMTKLYLWQKSFQIMKRIKKKKKETLLWKQCVWATDTISTDSKNKSHFDLLDWLQVLLTPSVTLNVLYVLPTGLPPASWDS